MLRISKKRFTFVKSNKNADKSVFSLLKMDMKDRIRQLMEAQHMTQQTFAQFIGMSTATLSSIFNERTKPTLNTVEAIKNKFPNISIDWLMFGKGPMFMDEKEDDNLSSTPQEGAAGEQMLDFGESGADGYQQNVQAATAGNNVASPRAPQHSAMRTDIIYKEKESRKITEIRVFYDDQTWESFVPKK